MQNKELLRHCVVVYNNWISKNIDEPILKDLKCRPEELESIFRELKELMSLIIDDQTNIDSLNGKYSSYLKSAILHTLDTQKENTKRRCQLTPNLEVKDQLERDVKQISKLTEGDWFKKTRAFITPKLEDFLLPQQPKDTSQREKHIGIESTSEREGMTKVRKPWYKKAWIWCLGFLSFIVLLTTAFLNLDTIIEKINGETGKQTPFSKQSNETENTLHNPILVASATVEVKITSDWDFNGRVGNTKASLAFVKGDKPLLITSSIGYTASQTGNDEVVYKAKLDMDAKDSAVGNPASFLKDAEYIQIEFGRMPSDSYVLEGDAICIINNSVRLEFSIPPQKLVNNRIFIRNLSESLQVLNEPRN